jgi:ATP-binding cassette, subfamily B, bacterial
VPWDRMIERWHDRLTDELTLWRLLRAAAPGSVVRLLVVSFARGLAPASLAVAIGVLIARIPLASGAGSGDGDVAVGSAQGRGLMVAVAAVAALVVAERALPPLMEVAQLRVRREIDGALRDRTFRAVAGRRTLTAVEGPEVQDRLATARGGLFGTAGHAVTAAVEVASRYVQTLSSVAVVAWFSWPLAAVLLVVVVAIRRRWHHAFHRLADALIESADRMRRSTYFSDLVLTPVAAKELRIFGLLDWFVARQRQHWDEATADAFAVRRRLRRQANLELAVLGAAYALTTVLVVRAGARGALGLGPLAAVLQCQFWAAQLIAPTVDDYARAGGVAALRSLAELERPASPPPGTGADPAPRVAGAPRDRVAFEHVTFRYPGADGDVLDDFCLEIPAGRSLAVVGANGAGKTTLLKLLCGLYTPDAGRVTVDGTDLAGADPDGWWRGIAAVFQDFNRYELSASENVLFGAWGRLDDSGRDRAATKAGVDGVIAGLPQGWDTVLSRQYDGGAELSGGQWQRIALARALAAVEAGASVLVLDEPTANLDVRAEAEMFDRLLAATRGLTTVLVSHRFSTVRRADRIVVVDRGRIVEQGSHAELMARGGIYARAFDLQAAQFRDGEAVADAEVVDA